MKEVNEGLEMHGCAAYSVEGCCDYQLERTTLQGNRRICEPGIHQTLAHHHAALESETLTAGSSES